MNVRSLLRWGLGVAVSLCALPQARLAESAWTTSSRELLRAYSTSGRGVWTDRWELQAGQPQTLPAAAKFLASKVGAACACGLGSVLLGWALGCLPGLLCCFPNVLLVKALVKDINNSGGRLTKIQNQPTDVECESKILLV